MSIKESGKKKTGRHLEKCNAPICQKGMLNDEIVWYANEAICTSRPFESWQKTQRKIQSLYKKGKCGNIEGYTFGKLRNMRRVKPGVQGDI